MIEQVDLLTQKNIIRHIQNKLEKLSDISELVSKTHNDLILESFLPTVISYFEAAVIDTIKEYILSRPYEIFNVDLISKAFDKKNIKSKELIDKGFEEYFIDEYLLGIEQKDHKGKLQKLIELCEVEFDLGVREWEVIKEAIARRNCLIHNDLIVNKTYLRQAGALSGNIDMGSQIKINASYLIKCIDNIKALLAKFLKILKDKYKLNTNINAVKRLWEYLFEEKYPLLFKNCWKAKEDSIIYKGPKLKELKECISPRTICLFSAWMSFFNGSYNGDLKYFSYLFYNSKEGRKQYSQKLQFLMSCFEKIDFQTFNIKVYGKP